MNVLVLSRKQVIVAIMIFVALLHFVTGRNYHGPWRGFVTGYLLDLLVPFAFYLLLTIPALGVSRFVRGMAVFAVGVAVEVLQFYGVPLFGRTFDPLDIVMYGLGVGAGILLDIIGLSRLKPT